MTQQPKITITRDIDIRVGRGIIDYKKGWTGRVVGEAFQKLKAADAIEVIAAKKPKAVKPAPAKDAKA